MEWDKDKRSVFSGQLSLSYRYTRFLAHSKKQSIPKLAQQQIAPTIGQLEVAGKKAIIAATNAPIPKRNVPAKEEAVPAIPG